MVEATAVKHFELEQKKAADKVRELAARESVFAVVGPVGSGTSYIAAALEEALKQQSYATKIIKARDAIASWASANGTAISDGDEVDRVRSLQDAGDKMREIDHAAVAVALIGEIRAERAAQLGKALVDGEPVSPDATPRAYILDSLRHPAEVHLLRSVYQDAFCLIGVVCDEDRRKERLQAKFRLETGSATDKKLGDFIGRDANAKEKHGQHVADTFHLADFFIDNTEQRFIEAGDGEVSLHSNPEWTALDELARLVDILTHARVQRPRPNEKAMFHAFGAQMRSSCLSRQVGAALMDERGDIVATGTNEVPRAGGGVYGDVFGETSDIDAPNGFDHRCFKHGGFCRNTKEQIAIVEELLGTVPEFSDVVTTPELIGRLRKTRIGQLIEFSRAVHAEMEVLLSAARQGKATRGLRLFVTTFPCHNCARHIVAAGVDEVQFIEPYLKSKALPLHGDAITTSKIGWMPPSALSTLTTEQLEKRGKAAQVLFRPFTGVAPRLYRRAFFKDRDLKNNDSGVMLTTFGPPDGVTTSRVSYAHIEASLQAANSRVAK